jgi:O-antigen/teichoic acid export membrane protein
VGAIRIEFGVRQLGARTSLLENVIREGRALGRDRLIIHNLVVGLGTVLAGFLGIAFQVTISHRLRPEDYGAVFAVVTLIAVIGLPATAVSLVMARETSRDLASGGESSSATLLARGNRALLIAGLTLACGIALASPFLSRFLDMPAGLLIAAATGIPFALALPLLLGEFQGEQHFVTYAGLAVGQAAVKLVAAIAGGVIAGPLGIIAGMSMGTFFVYIVGIWLLRHRFSRSGRGPWLGRATAYLAIVLPSTLALSVLLSSDVLLVKHYFAPSVAGEYAVVAAIGRAIFYGATGIATVLFPKMIFRGTRGESGSPLVRFSLLSVALGGLFGLGVLVFRSTWLITAFAGVAYVGGARYLLWYAVGMTMLGGASVLITVHQSLAKPAFLALLLPLALLEPGLIIAFHKSLTQVVIVVDASLALIVFALWILYALQAPGRSSRPSLAESEFVIQKAAREVGVNP